MPLRPWMKIPEDDWTDQDILTRGEAGGRLDEIEVVTGERVALPPPILAR